MLYIYEFKYDPCFEETFYKSYIISDNIKETSKTYSLSNNSYFPGYRKKVNKSDLDKLCVRYSDYSMISDKPNEALFKKLLIENLNLKKANLEKQTLIISNQLEYVNKL